MPKQPTTRGQRRATQTQRTASSTVVLLPFVRPDQLASTHLQIPLRKITCPPHRSQVSRPIRLSFTQHKHTAPCTLQHYSRHTPPLHQLRRGGRHLTFPGSMPICCISVPLPTTGRNHQREHVEGCEAGQQRGQHGRNVRIRSVRGWSGAHVRAGRKLARRSKRWGINSRLHGSMRGEVLAEHSSPAQ